MQFKVTTNKEAIAESSGSSYISKSGIYDVTIKFASLDVSSGGAESVNFNLDYNGNDQTIYGPYVTSKAGDTIEIGAKLINKLGIIAGMTDNDEFVIEQEEHVVGKDNTNKEFAVITNFSDLAIKIRLQEEYSRNPNNGEIKKRMVIKSFFREDGASAEEIIDGGEIGKRLAIETEKYSTNVTYADSRKGANDAPTPEEVQAWKDAKASGAKAPAAKSTPTTTKPAGGSLFK